MIQVKGRVKIIGGGFVVKSLVKSIAECMAWIVLLL